MSSRRPISSQRVRHFETQVHKREKEHQHEALWKNYEHYYQQCDLKSAKFEEWSSPRYQETHSKLLADLRKTKEHEASLETRRTKLRNLINEEERLYQTEMMIVKTKKSIRPRKEDIPVEVLKELNLGIKIEEDHRRRHKAELELYHQWRSNNPTLKHYERMYKGRELKLSWLDQQIESRMKKEREEEECRRILSEREKFLKEEEAKDVVRQQEITKKQEEMKAYLDRQMEDLRMRTKLSEELERKELEEKRKQFEMDEIRRQLVEYERKKQEQECVLFNVKQYRQRLKQKATMIEENLEQEKAVLKQLRDLEMIEEIEDGVKKQQIKESLSEFLDFNRRQKDLEKLKHEHCDFFFDSEAKALYEQECEEWRREDEKRKKLLDEVMLVIQQQLNDNIQKSRDERKLNIQEREELIKKAAEYNRELEELKEEEVRRRRDRKRELDVEVKRREIQKKENEDMGSVEEELEKVRKEEERLRREIINIQRRVEPIRPKHNRLFF